MNKFLKILGGIFLAVLVIVGVVAAIFIPKGLALDRDAVAYIETNVPPIVETWSSEELVRRAAPEMLSPSAKEQMPKMFSWLASLGKLKRLDKPVGQVGRGVYPGTQFSGTWGDYVANAEFDGGPAQIRVVLRRSGDSWQIIGFHVNSPALLRSPGEGHG